MDQENNNLTFKGLYKKAFKKDPLIDFKKPEAYISAIISIIILILLFILYQSNNIDTITSIIQNLLLYISAGLIGMLGFIISGLSIISGTLGKEKVEHIKANGTFDNLLSILFSFYYIGIVIGFLIVIYFVTYIIISIDIEMNFIFYIIWGGLISYGFLFSIFYSVSLLNTCIQIFILNYGYEVNKSKIDNNKKSLEKIDIDIEFNSRKIDTITHILINKHMLEPEGFINDLVSNIESNSDQRDVQNLLKKVQSYYGVELIKDSNGRYIVKILD